MILITRGYTFQVEVKSQLKYDRNRTTVTADTTFPEVRGRLYVSVGAWKGPKARAFAKLGNFNTTFTGLTENPETQKLHWGFYKVVRDIFSSQHRKEPGLCDRRKRWPGSLALLLV
ncbi:hypothetical protein MTO96_026266, partial [Rhipicephalus appendiculatus]